MNTTEEKRIEGAVMIGRYGKKLHPASVTIKADGKRDFWIHCQCSGTQNGFAYNNHPRFFANAVATCRI